MAKVHEGKIVTADQICAYLAKEAGAEVTCHMTAGLFINISAHASEERDTDHIPWWRTLKAGGELNEKYPGGIERQKQLLEMEGQTVECKGKRCFVKDYEEKRYIFS